MFDSIDLEKRYRSTNNNNSDNVPLQIYKTCAKPEEQDECRDDDVCIAAILQRSASTRTKNEEEDKDEELRLAMQRAWAVLDADEPAITPAPTVVAAATTEEFTVLDKPMISTSRIQTVPLKTLTTRIYIDDAKNHKVVQLTNLLTTAMVVQYLKKKGLLDNTDDWALFEIDNDHGLERPFREWEIVLDVLSAWDLDANNALLVKKYSFHSTLTMDCMLQKKNSPMTGWISIEYKKGKWQKRYCFIKDNSIYHAKDNKGSTTSILCHLATYDVYTLLQPLKISPTPFVFAIRAQDRSNVFEKEGDYMRFLAVEKQEDMEDWVLSIRCAKSNIQYQHNPNRVMNPLAPISLEAPEETSLRRHKSLKDITHKEEPTRPLSTLSRSESMRRVNDEKRRNGTSRGLSRSHTVKESSDNGPLIDCFDKHAFVKGSLLASKEETPDRQLYHHEENSNTLIQIDDRVKFAKGSLLDKKENQMKITRSKSVREVSTTSIEESSSSPASHRRHVSLKRKPTRKHHDVPLPANNNNNNNNNNSSTLLRLDDSPEKFHSRELHERHVKPLLNFDEQKPLLKK